MGFFNPGFEAWTLDVGRLDGPSAGFGVQKNRLEAAGPSRPPVLAERPQKLPLEPRVPPARFGPLTPGC